MLDIMLLASWLYAGRYHAWFTLHGALLHDVSPLQGHGITGS